MEKRMTIYDIAKAVGVSKTTVSRYLNGQYEHMSSETKSKIERTIYETNYNPSNLARGLKSKHSSLIGIIANTLQYQVAALFVRGLHDICTSSGYSTIIYSSDNLLHRETSELKMCLSQQVDGIALIPIDVKCDYYHTIQENGTPIVLCNRYREDWKHDGVYVDNVALCRQAWQHLADNGFTRIALFTDNDLPESNKALRESAFLEFANQVLGVEGNETLYRVKQSAELVKSCLYNFMYKYPNEKKAVFAINTNTLFLMLREIKAMNLDIPQDIGVCGYDLLGWAELIPPGITTLEQPFYELGVVTGKQLLRRIEGPLSQQVEEIWLNGTIKKRGSTAL
ncbi:MAG: LacI family transcriptional regulator [Synergistaceae bacterium]|jgi:LacI family kdg operon repressor|nr:LacI family transcriptional regulator [Synergistaceae bacterium]